VEENIGSGDEDDGKEIDDADMEDAVARDKG